MSVSMSELVRAREVVEGLLEELHISAYRFEVEPRGETWEILIECTVRGGWMRRELKAGREELLRGGDDAVVRQRLLDDWTAALSACQR